MTTLSSYQAVASIYPEHDIFLVQQKESRKFFVKKLLSVYQPAVYKQLKDQPIQGIPHIQDIFQQEDCLVVIEEYISGDTLQEILDTKGKLSDSEILPLMLQLCDILSALHESDPPIIHRDIKPSNIILTPSGKLVLLDFNAAKYISEEKETDTILLGTKGYAAPEQYGLASSSIQTDIYAMGVLMNTLAAGNLSSQCTTTGKLAPIIKKCIKWDPSERYKSIILLQQDLALLAPHTPCRSHRKTGWRGFLPPGFRSGNPLHILAAVIGYPLLLWFSLSITIDDFTPIEQTLEKILLTLAVFSVVLFSCNYRNIQSFFPLCDLFKNKVLRFFWILIWDFLILFAALFILALIHVFFFS